MKRAWKSLRPLRLLLVTGLAIFWGLSYAPKTQKLAPRSVLLNPPKTAVGWSDGAVVVARTTSVPKRQQVFPVKWARWGFGYEHFDLDRAQPPYTPSAVTFKAYDFKAVRVPFWFPIVLVVLPTLAAALHRVAKGKRCEDAEVQSAGSGGAA